MKFQNLSIKKDFFKEFIKKDKIIQELKYGKIKKS